MRKSIALAADRRLHHHLRLWPGPRRGWRGHRLPQLPGWQIPEDRSGGAVRRPSAHRRQSQRVRERLRKAARTDCRRSEGRQAGDPSAKKARAGSTSAGRAMAMRTSRLPFRSCSGATIAGSGGIKVDKVQGDRFDGTVAGSGGSMWRLINVQSLKLAIAGSGGAKAASGKAQSAEYESPGRAMSMPAVSQTQQAEGVDRRLRQRQGSGDRHRRRQHHGLGRCRRFGRCEVQREQGWLRQRPLLLKRH